MKNLKDFLKGYEFFVQVFENRLGDELKRLRNSNAIDVDFIAIREDLVYNDRPIKRLPFPFLVKYRIYKSKKTIK